MKRGDFLKRASILTAGFFIGNPLPIEKVATMTIAPIDTTTKYETIAGWMRISKKAMSDIPYLISWLQTSMPEKLMEEEPQIQL